MTSPCHVFDSGGNDISSRQSTGNHVKYMNCSGCVVKNSSISHPYRPLTMVS
jgi:hypothetical protein